MTQVAPTTKRARLKSDDRRAAYLEAAAAIVVEQGVAAVTMDRVAAQSGVDKRLGYRFFANRTVLLEALLDRELAAVGAAARAVLPANPAFPVRLRVNVGIWLEAFSARGPLLSRLLYDQGPLAEHAAVIRRESQDDWVRDALAAYDLDPVRAGIVTRIMQAGLVGAVDASHAGIGTPEQIADLYTAIVVAGVEAVADQPRRLLPRIVTL